MKNPKLCEHLIKSVDKLEHFGTPCLNTTYECELGCPWNCATCDGEGNYERKEED